jgi:hypothetical protein
MYAIMKELVSQFVREMLNKPGIMCLLKVCIATRYVWTLNKKTTCNKYIVVVNCFLTKAKFFPMQLRGPIENGK